MPAIKLKGHKKREKEKKMREKLLVKIRGDPWGWPTLRLSVFEVVACPRISDSRQSTVGMVVFSARILMTKLENDFSKWPVSEES